MTASNRRAILILAVLISAAIHFSRAAADPEISLMFTLNGVGSIVLLLAYLAPALQTRRGLVRNIFLAYTGLTLVLYFVWAAMSADWTLPLGPIAKIAEGAIVAILWAERQTG
jgi:hypothetical protein